jgi:hypothetical protein
VSQGLLPVYADWECVYALKPDGEPVYDNEGEWRSLTNVRHRHIVFAQAAERYPLLSQLRPQRGPEDPDCPSCGGTGEVRVPGVTDPGKLMCECGGLGWYPAGSEMGPF